MSFQIGLYWVIGVIIACFVGNTLIFYGFGYATEQKINKRVRDLAFSSLVRQEVASLIHQVSVA
jgi:hypothetical protein